MRSLGQKLKRARELAGLTQGEAATKVGLVSGSSISMFESGKREPDLATLRKLAQAYEVPVEDFVTLVDTSNVVINKSATLAALQKLTKASTQAVEDDNALFDALIKASGYRRMIDSEGRLLAFRRGTVVDITPDTLDHITSRVLEYFELLMLGASEK